MKVTFLVLFFVSFFLAAAAWVGHWGYGWELFLAFCAGQYWTQFWGKFK